MSRPEHQAPPEIFYNSEEAKKYTANSRIIQIQNQLSERCVELLALPEGEPCFLLDIGCGSGLSGEVLTEAGHHWVGLDISSDMLGKRRKFIRRGCLTGGREVAHPQPAPTPHEDCVDHQPQLGQFVLPSCTRFWRYCGAHALNNFVCRL
eukprot:m.88497 g.88497  ORF g.88497 m.88497 type:complete len:150 (+) comp14944_c1_seq1:286-735(+)